MNDEVAGPGGPEYEYEWHNAGPAATSTHHPACEFCGGRNADQRVTGRRLRDVMSLPSETIQSVTYAICGPCRWVFADQPGMAWILAEISYGAKRRLDWHKEDHHPGRKRRMR